MAEIGDWVIVTLSSGLELSATKRDEGKWYIYYRDKNGNLVQLTDEWGNQIYLEITSAGRKAIRKGRVEEKTIIEKALKGTTPSLSEDGNTYYIGIGSYEEGGDIYAYNYMGRAKIQKDNVSITTTTTTTQGPELTGGAKGEEKADTGIITTIPTKATITTPKPAAGGEEKSVTKEVTIDISTFTKKFEPGEVGVVGGRYTVVYLRNNETGITTALIFSPPDDKKDNIKITNLNDGRVTVEGKGADKQPIKVIVDTRTGDVTTETGERVTRGVYTNWEYAKGKTRVEARAGSTYLQHNQCTQLTYTSTQTQQKMGVTH